ncbi:hypothetical protein SO802_029817 [Lithocarpus litseifolius]|uniref:Gnk2-homologous domain-containing protein n=1 Tax=Lithocarpus litseifolius TaxID=425828 RepID=A0AAW2BVT4_9ROSI
MVLMCNNQNVTQTSPFRQWISNLLSQVANDSAMTKSMYAIGRLELDGSNKLYGLTQCTRDISSSDYSTEIQLLTQKRDLDGDSPDHT